MRKLLACAAAMLALTLTACSGRTALVSVEGSAASFPELKASAHFPEGWSVYSGDDIYEQIFKAYSDGYSDAAELKSFMEESGLDYLVYAAAPDSSAIVTVTVQDMSDDAEEDKTTVSEYIHQRHDTTVINYQASGYGIKDGFCDDHTAAGVQGVLSHYEIYSSEEEFVIGQSEFAAEVGDNMYLMQFCYSTTEGREPVLRIFEGLAPIAE